MDDRTLQMVSGFLGGRTLQEVGDAHCVSRERVRQILSKVGIKAQDGGANLKAIKKHKDALSERDNRHLKRYGVDYKGYLCIPTGARKAFNRQRDNARARGFSWAIGMWEWWELWQKSGRWEKRGQSADSFVLSRIRMARDFTPDNVYVCTLREAGRFGMLLRNSQ